MKPIRIKEMGVTTGPIVRVCVCVFFWDIIIFLTDSFLFFCVYI